VVTTVALLGWDDWACLAGMHAEFLLLIVILSCYCFIQYTVKATSLR